MADPKKLKRLGVFYAHPSNDPAAKIRKERRELCEFLERRSHGKMGPDIALIISVTSGRAEHKHTFTGDWERWQRAVVKRKHATTGDIRYHMFVVPNKECGRATAGILKMALREGRKVCLWDRESEKISKVYRIESFDPEDWTTGFRVSTQSEE
jgi:hypothetical protein